LAAAGALLLLVASVGWLSDDSFITLRVVANVWDGYGLRWNAIERVQVFTHPLWMLVLAAAYGITREAFWTVIVLSLASVALLLSLVTTRVARTGTAAWLAVALFASSKAFVEFSTSGLENPLTHVLLASFVIVAWSDRERPASPWRLSGLAALVALCRLDLLALIVPVWLAQVATSSDRATPRLRRVGAALLGWWPLAAWLAFAWIYYGSPLPNTARAKLPPNVPWIDLARQGALYLRDSLVADPVTLATIAGAVAHALVSARDRATAIGLALAVATVVSVGGDFMSGRFLTPAFVLAVCHVVRHGTWSPRSAAAVAALALATSAAMPESPLRVWRHARAEERIVTHGHGILDERAVYAGHTGVWSTLQGRGPATHPWARRGRAIAGVPQVSASDAVGLLGFYAGPGTHLIDPMALTDPLLARLPAEVPWRIGHFRRPVPAGYTETVRLCVALAFPANAVAPPASACILDERFVNHIADPDAAALYRRTALLAQAPLLAHDRIAAIID
jgi:arabinofuranosyltransferase